MSPSTVTCPYPDSTWPGPHQESRVICIFGKRDACKTCEKRNFTLVFPYKILDQSVMCPRWELDADRESGFDPITYVPIKRSTCFKDKPYPYCSKCQNSKAWEYPRVEKGWVEDEQRRRLEVIND